MGWYCPLILRRRVQPAPATWIIGCLAMNLAMVSYHAIPGRTVIENVTLYVAALEIVIVLTVLMWVLWRSGEFRVAFDWVQKSCLVVMALALGYWAFHRDQSHVTFWTTQAMLVVAYLATIGKALQRREAFDSLGNWGLILTGSLVGSIPAIMMESSYGLMNSARAIIASGFTFYLLCRLDRKSGWSRWRDEVTTLSGVYGEPLRKMCRWRGIR